MSVLRRDPTTARWVVMTDGSRPVARPPGPCPFCEGNERLTPPEIVAWGRKSPQRDQPGWAVRVIPNASPLLRVDTEVGRHADGMYDAARGMGAHEIVVETPQHVSSLSSLPAEAIGTVLAAWAQRIEDLKRDKRLRSIFVFKNQGTRAGALLPDHAHSQVIGLPVVPKVLRDIMEGARSYYQVHERCVFCDVLREELDRRQRLIGVTERFAAFAPFASRHPFEVWVAPREHAPDFEVTGDAERRDLAELLGKLLRRLETALPEPAYNLFLYSGPNRQAFPTRWRSLPSDFHWHIQILPRVEQEAGFELGSGFYANPVSPESAAAALKLA
ncbi:MAG TPA: galactose-1-phosphate uridylyltransferase [Candidatus Eisenbacteria bacterium]